MDELNHLQVCFPLNSPAAKNKNANRSGRPRMRNLIQFGPQPKSIMAQMFSETKTKKELTKNISSDDDKDDIICLDDQLGDSLDVEKIEEHICPVCAYRSKSKKEHKEHLTKHKQFVCDFPNCSYSCKLSSNLIKHKRVHTNEKPYLCERCCFRSNFVNSLKVHKRTHTAERPYQCVHCSYKCNSSSNLKKHSRHKHPDVPNNCQCAKA